MVVERIAPILSSSLRHIGRSSRLDLARDCLVFGQCLKFIQSSDGTEWRIPLKIRYLSFTNTRHGS